MRKKTPSEKKILPAGSSVTDPSEKEKDKRVIIHEYNEQNSSLTEALHHEKGKKRVVCLLKQDAKSDDDEF